MQLKLLKSKLHQAAVTGCALHYHGSLTIDPELMDAVGILPYESILISNMSNGARAETYAIPGEPGGRRVELNGSMARLGTPGDRLIVMAFALLEADEVEGHRPRVVALDAQNRIVDRLDDAYTPIAAAAVR
ncbi:aspartate 1-decarboxylase [Tautonia plasticadhaerens]|uniref:Aspartate 1-decarboxylase n=1 Tax=Tautonia plasticadhaerens TaxID=2527974 RepID=A0A518H2Y8_9BACT|nr:aspartate 1-decarboxylase [Tautonia plasticadhaerens]QDV35201.1 Aspartate 1-decarboxylase precursor [Tautonia plasticadhaerens]